MDKREKVLQGLSKCELYGQTLQYCLEQECPYVEQRGKTGECVHFLHEDAVEVLKEQEARELTKKEWETWKKSPRRDPICMVYHQDTTPIWVLDPAAVNEVLYYMGKIKLFTNKPEREAVKWDG